MLNDIPVPDNGIVIYTLYFPPVGNDVKTIDYLENQWKTYGIELVQQEKFSIFPEPLLGNWLRTDGSNEWGYSFHEERVVYNSEIWQQVLISQKEDLYEVVFQNEGQRMKIIVKQQDNLLLIGNDKDNLSPFSREITQKPDYVIANDEEFRLPVFQKDSSVYRGLIKGYHPDMGTTGILYVNNVIAADQESYLISIQPDGTFKSKFPMIYPQQVLVRMMNFTEGIYCEPGNTTFQLFDFSKPFDEKGPSILFMGPTAKINQDLMTLKSIRYFDYGDMTAKILDMSPEDYKTYFLDIKRRELEALNEMAQNNALSKKALQIKRMQISFSADRNILILQYEQNFSLQDKTQSSP